MVLVGTIVRSHGLRGSVIVQPETDFPERRFQAGSRLFVRPPGTLSPRQVTVREARPHVGRLLVSFEGVESVEDAEALGRVGLRVPAAQLGVLPPGRYYHHDLLGCAVVTTVGDPVGVVVRIEGTGAATMLVVDGRRGEVLVPFAQDICPEVDLDARRITVAPPEGLLELNA
jgi:16S rRNA processing protein RimM